VSVITPQPTDVLLKGFSCGRSSVACMSPSPDDDSLSVR
jgi:hypothetical protein